MSRRMAGPERFRLAQSGKGFVAEKKDAEYLRLRNIGQCAKHRCSPGRCYHKKGIRFVFDSGKAFAEYVIANLGGRPSPEYSIDRINNLGHYEPGNLRWATWDTQANNKRQYKRTDKGERVRALQEAGSPFEYETLRGFINSGMSDADILARKKSTSGRPRKC